MGYPVRIIGGTDRVQPDPPNGPFYEIGETIPNLSDEKRLSLQRSGVRFEAVHDDTPPMPVVIDVAPALPEDQQVLNEQIANAEKTAKKEKA